MLNLFAALAAAALEQRRAMSEAQAREAEARSLSSRLANAQEEERTRIASLLHDAIGGQLTLIQKNTELLRTMFPTEEAADPLPGGQPRTCCSTPISRCAIWRWI